MKTSCSPEGDLKYGVFGKNGQQLKYIGKVITPIPDTLTAIPSKLLTRLVKLTPHKPSFHFERVDNFYPNHVNALLKAGPATPTLPTMVEREKGQDEKTDI